MKSTAFLIVLAVFSFAAVTATANPTITIYTDSDTYQSGDTIEVSLSGANDDAAMSVDVYVGIVLPDGDIWSAQYDRWRNLIDPWLSSTYVPAWFEMSRTPLWTFDLPYATPPIGGQGQYYFASVLTYPSTFESVSMASLAPFTIAPSTAAHFYVNAELGRDSNDGHEDAPWQTITHALANVEGSEETPVTIHVAAGLYSVGWFGIGGETFPLVMKSWVSLSGTCPERTILDAKHADESQVIFCWKVDHMTIEGLTITGGRAGSDSTYLGGGGVACYSSSPTIANCIIRHNVATGEGGGIYCCCSSAIIADNIIASNSARFSGGGIHLESDSSLVLDNIISHNSTCGGGGIFTQHDDDDTPPTISGNVIYENTVSMDGGGIVCYVSYAIVSNNTISQNSAADSGGGIYTYSCQPTIGNNTIAGNFADLGGGIACTSFSSATITNNTIADNSANSGGGIHCTDRALPVIADCIIWGNGTELYGNTRSATYCCIEGDEQGEGNIHADPMFVIGPLGEYYLDPNSPCLDAGSRPAEEAGISDRTTQADGAPDTGMVDMGYHYPLPPSQ